jgi:hypothetical protein
MGEETKIFGSTSVISLMSFGNNIREYSNQIIWMLKSRRSSNRILTWMWLT